MRKVGVIGGLGPETTAKFYLEVVFGCHKRNKESRPLILIGNVPIRFDIEEDLIVRAIGEERFLPFLVETAQALEKGGADFLVMPCNSLDAFIDQIRDSVKIPVLSIVEETCKSLKKQRVKKVGILATQSSLKNNMHKNALGKHGIGSEIPENEDKKRLGDIIHKSVLNMHTEQDAETLLEVIERMGAKGVNDILLACTDLQLLIQQHPKLSIHDTMKILAEATIEEIMKPGE